MSPIVSRGRLAAAISATWPPTSSGWTRARRSALNTVSASFRAARLASSAPAIARSEFFADTASSGKVRRWFEVVALASIEGGDNFKDAKSPALGAVVSRRAGDAVAFYVEPIWVNNSNPFPKEVVDHNDTFIIGLGARIRIRPTVYIVGEFSPRVSGYRPGSTQGGIAIEKRAGGHQFQLNFGDAFGTTMTQIARVVRTVRTGTWGSISRASSFECRRNGGSVPPPRRRGDRVLYFFTFS